MASASKWLCIAYPWLYTLAHVCPGIAACAFSTRAAPLRVHQDICTGRLSQLRNSQGPGTS
eukprot:13994258-Alexandrium_andersonii.AAC.1